MTLSIRMLAAMLPLAWFIGPAVHAEAAVNDDFEDRTPVSIPANFTADTTGATWQQGEPIPTCGENDDISVWYSFELAEQTPLSIVVDDPNQQVTMTILTGGSLDSLSELLCNYGFRQTHPFDTSYLFEPGVYALRISHLESFQGPVQVSIQERSWEPSAGDDWNAPIAVEYPVEMELDVTANSTQADSPQSCLPAFDDVWLTFTAPRREAVNISTTGSDYSTTISIWRVENGPQERIDCIHYWPQDDEPSEQAILPVALVEGETYLVQIAARWQPYGRNRYLRLSIEPWEGPLHDEAVDAIALSNREPKQGSLGGATAEPGEEPCLGGTRSSVWYRYEADGSGSATVTLADEQYWPSTLALYELSQTGLTRIGCDEQRIDFEPTEGTTYLVRIGSLRPVGLFEVTVREGPPPITPSEEWRVTVDTPLGQIWVGYEDGKFCVWNTLPSVPRYCHPTPVPIPGPPQ
ncbi:MAG: hypothetical protein ACLGH3_05645 [Actinomycetota bacterium]